MIHEHNYYYILFAYHNHLNKPISGCILIETSPSNHYPAVAKFVELQQQCPVQSKNFVRIKSSAVAVCTQRPAAKNICHQSYGIRNGNNSQGCKARFSDYL